MCVCVCVYVCVCVCVCVCLMLVLLVSFLQLSFIVINFFLTYYCSLFTIYGQNPSSRKIQKNLPFT
ncbi:uncharacterized protein BX663DRAFT_506803 [Cokeromyces recurvatus]|uniref:uncharacterized protein n=1 Tax=Cokeromyces recurvatus TaxID=90255 RepID=UPI00221E8E58|nr:uncharacterized protein BX663DRAFT_506803 [Cokeromyces recurvatus]KAI7903539.1 hypothetical protein BX663DRAFT_506803 [Cokeromyces recurvatus]